MSTSLPHGFDAPTVTRCGRAEPLFAAVRDLGIDRVYPRPGDRPWNFVLHDGGSRRIDLHFYDEWPDGSLHYGSASHGEVLPVGALAGEGVIAGIAVACEAPEWAVRCRQGFEARDKDRHDVVRLCDRFGLQLPAQFRF